MEEDQGRIETRRAGPCGKLETARGWAGEHSVTSPHQAQSGLREGWLLPRLHPTASRRSLMVLNAFVPAADAAFLFHLVIASLHSSICLQLLWLKQTDTKTEE